MTRTILTPIIILTPPTPIPRALLKVEHSVHGKLIRDPLGGEAAVDPRELIDDPAVSAEEEGREALDAHHRAHRRRRVRVEPAEEALEVRGGERTHVRVQLLRVERVLRR